MNSSAADSIREIEPSFRETSPWRGYWQLGGRPAYLRGDDGWLEASMPLCGEGGVLLPRQCYLPGLAKVAAGDFLLAEIPAERPEWAGAFQILRGELERGLDFFEGAPVSPAGSPLDQEKLSECLAASGVVWSARGSEYSTPLEDDPAPASFAIAEAVGAALAIRSSLLRFRAPGERPAEALTHFLLALNRRLRLARGSLTEDGVVLEVVLPAACLTPPLVGQAVRSLWAGAAAARRECAALLNPDVAEAYLQFHLKGEDA